MHIHKVSFHVEKFDLNQITNKNDINQLLSSQIIYLESIKMNTVK